MPTLSNIKHPSRESLQQLTLAYRDPARGPAAVFVVGQTDHGLLILEEFPVSESDLHSALVGAVAYTYLLQADTDLEIVLPVWARRALTEADSMHMPFPHPAGEAEWEYAGHPETDDHSATPEWDGSALAESPAR